MTTITLPRATVEQVLEALDAYSWEQVDAARTALRAALAQQAEPVAYTTGHCENHKQKGGCQLHNLQCGWPDCDRKPSAALAQQAEPLTLRQLCDALVASRIIPPAAVEDPEEYDDWVTLHRIKALHRRIT